MSEKWEVVLPDDISQELASLDDDRVNQVVCDAVRDALGIARDAEEKRDALREKMGLDGRDSAELNESGDKVAQKQTELREKMGPR